VELLYELGDTHKKEATILAVESLNAGTVKKGAL
jgi:hypothetical protein